ncbi:hypothetical protein PLESTF_000652900 [Pleodorina starrii]|nr:hypothetical protein PLESTF_000652900 [Pleodorina starrii]
MRMATRNVFGFTILVALIYCALYLAVGPDLLPGGNAWSTLLIFLASHVGGAICGALGLPPLLGMLLAGLLLRNATPSLVAGLPPSWSATFRALALGTIFLRSGLELDLQMFRRVGPAAVRLLLLPGLAEAFVTAGAAVGIMKMPVFWALTQGFILKAVGPAVVIQTMFDLQKRGLGVNKGIPAIVVGAASFDDMVAISGYSLFSSFAMSSISSGEGHGSGGGGKRHGLAMTLLHGPIDISLGVVAGLVGASLCAATRLWDSSLKRTAVVFSAAMALLFALYRYDYRGGGALAALVLGLAVNVFWERGSLFFWGLGRRSGLTRGPQPRYSHEVEARVGLFWRVVAQPLLFGIIGSLVNLRTVSGETIPKSLAIIAIGMAIRIPITFFAMTGAGLTLRERVFVAIAWTPKATVQAALGAQPLDMIRAAVGPNSPSLEIGHEILTTSVFAILVCANIGVSLIHYLAPRWLHRTVPDTTTLAATSPPPAAVACHAAADSCGGGGGGAAAVSTDEPSGTDAPAAVRDGGGGGGMRPLRIGPVDWQESYSPTPRSIRRNVQDGGGALAAAVAASRGGGLWCRCADGGVCGDGGGAGGLRDKLPRGGRPPLPPSAPPPLSSCRSDAADQIGAAAGTVGGSSDSDSSSGSESDDDGGGTASMSATEASGGEKGTTTPRRMPKVKGTPPRLQAAGLRRCRRCRGLLPPPPSLYCEASPGKMDSPPTVQRPHRPRPSARIWYGDGGGGDGTDIESGGAATSAPPLTPTRVRRHSAPVLTDAQLAEHLLDAAAAAATLPPQPFGAVDGPGGAPVLQRQLVELERAAAAIAVLAARVASGAAPPSAGPIATNGDSGGGGAVAAAAAPSFSTDAEELAARAAALRRAAGAVRLHVSAVVSAAAAATDTGGQADWMSGEEADDEGAGGGRDGSGPGAQDEPPPPETAREFFRRVKAAAAEATAAAADEPLDPAVAAPPPHDAAADLVAASTTTPAAAGTAVVIPIITVNGDGNGAAAATSATSADGSGGAADGQGAGRGAGAPGAN